MLALSGIWCISGIVDFRSVPMATKLIDMMSSGLSTGTDSNVHASFPEDN